ncbi:MAG: Na+/H+ antiporter NhaA [Chloroflexi bacterium]|nr:Na+/H+ antiporter NhaA [Chloroflexota bacterium]MDA1148027.1 Na+/H+ antiporter NhaA [Chloroflexota bacterium]
MAVAVEPPLPPGVRQIRLVRPVQRFIQTEAAGGIILLVGAVIALIWVNSPWSQSYHDLFEHHLSFDLGFFAVDETLHFWINDAAMVVFFFVVGMEIKREAVVGELASMRRVVVPAAAAVGGMVVPVIIFFALVSGSEARGGWAIPMATDIAFAVGVLVLVGPRIPTGLKVMLLAMAIVDDLGAIAVIAVFYTDSIDLNALAIVGALLVLVYALNRFGMWYIPVYFIIGGFAWMAMLQSGVHATIIGVLLGLMTPWRSWHRPEDFPAIAEPMLQRLRPHADEDAHLDREERVEALLEIAEVGQKAVSPLDRLEHSLQRPVAFVIVPIFALANAGVELSPDTLGDVFGSSLTWGVALGLLLGKPIGVTLGIWLAVKAGARLPLGVTWLQVIGMSLLGAIGFTVSLFVTELSFETELLLVDAKVGILLASAVAGGLGYGMLRVVTRPTRD